MILLSIFIFIVGFGVGIAYVGWYLPEKKARRALQQNGANSLGHPSEFAVSLVGFTICDFGKCGSRELVNCVSDYCHRHCPEKCGCGAGAEAVRLIEKYGSLRQAEKELPFEIAVPKLSITEEG